MLVIRTRAVLSFAILSGLLAYACPRPAIAFEATAPLTASSGSVGLTVGDCTGDGKALTYASSAFGCNTITGTLQKVKIQTADLTLTEQANGGTAPAAISALSGLDVSGAGKTYIIEAVLTVTQKSIDPSLYIMVAGVAAGQPAESYAQVRCVGDSNKNDRNIGYWSGETGGFGSAATFCDMPQTTHEMTIRIVFVNGASSTATKTVYAYWQGAAYNASADRNGTLHRGSFIRVWEVDVD